MPKPIISWMDELLISNYEQDLYDGHTGKTGELFA